MKFVKGDTIAGLVITVINVLGGLSAGVFQRGMTVGMAAKQYTVLTIGDGLVAQIPALLVSLAAGFIVTRVSDKDSDKSLGGEIGAQIFVKPMALLTASGMSVLLAFVPGFPTALFLSISLFVAAFALALLWRSKKVARDMESIEQHRVDPISDGTDLGHATPLVLELGTEMYDKFLEDDRWRVCLNELFPKLKSHLSHQMGIPYPELKIKVNETMAPERYMIKIYEIPVDEGFLSPQHCVVRDELDNASKIKLQTAEKKTETVHGTSVMLLQLRRHQELIEQGIKVLSPEEMLLRHLSKVLKKHASDFIGIQEVRDILTNVEHHHPELVREVIPRMLTIHKFTDVIKRLVEEGVPVKDFRLILETLSGIQPEGKDPVDLTEMVRMGLRRVITHRHVDSQNRLACFGLDIEMENEVSKAIQKRDGECYLTLPPDRIEAIGRAIGLAYRNHKLAEKEAVILTSSEVRRYMRKVIETELPDVVVLSYQELDPKVLIDQRDTISTVYPEVVSI